MEFQLIESCSLKKNNLFCSEDIREDGVKFDEQGTVVVTFSREVGLEREDLLDFHNGLSSIINFSDSSCVKI